MKNPGKLNWLTLRPALFAQSGSACRCPRWR
jgi:hypothetical protein